MQWLHKILTLAIICAAVVCAQECPSTCKCTRRSLNCSNTPIPGDRLTKSILNNYGYELETIIWINSNITLIEVSAFDGLNNLNYIDLSRNNIRRTEHGLFARLTDLKYIDMSRNEIEDLPSFTFGDLLNVEYLDISYNNLRAIPFQVFRQMGSLQHLDISYNKLATFLDYYFRRNRQLKKLFLNNNSLVNITSKALVNLKELEVLDISSNQLHNIPKFLFDNLEELRELNISYNNFFNISQDALKNLSKLKLLNIGGNGLKVLPSMLFQYNEYLETIYLDHTDIDVIQNTNFKGLHNLKHLFIRNNLRLIEIEPFVFQDVPTITNLDISSNALTYLPLSLNMLTQLEELRIHGNPWACDCRMAWFGNWIEKRKEIVKTDLSCRLAYPNDMLAILNNTNCKPPSLRYSSPLSLHRLQNDALLQCVFDGNPAPSITWITPTRDVYHWNPNELEHGKAHDHAIDYSKSRVKIREDGSLHISDIHIQDWGTYICFATNPSGNATVEVVLNLEPMTMFEIKFD